MGNASIRYRCRRSVTQATQFAPAAMRSRLIRRRISIVTLPPHGTSTSCVAPALGPILTVCVPARDAEGDARRIRRRRARRGRRGAARAVGGVTMAPIVSSGAASRSASPGTATTGGFASGACARKLRRASSRAATRAGWIARDGLRQLESGSPPGARTRATTVALATSKLADHACHSRGGAGATHRWAGLSRGPRVTPRGVRRVGVMLSRPPVSEGGLAGTCSGRRVRALTIGAHWRSHRGIADARTPR